MGGYLDVVVVTVVETELPIDTPHRLMQLEVVGHERVENHLRSCFEVGYPELIGSLCLELAMDPVQRARCGSIGDSGLHDFAPHHTTQAGPAHQAFDGAAGGLDAFSAQLAPDFFCAINLHISLPDTLNLRHQHLVAPGARAAQIRIAPLRGVTPVAGRGDLQDFANRLAPIRGGAGR